MSFMLEYPQFVYTNVIDSTFHHCDKKRLLELVAINCDREESLLIQRNIRLRDTNAYYDPRPRSSRSKLETFLAILEPTSSGAFAQIDHVRLFKDERWSQLGEEELFDEYCQKYSSNNSDIELARSAWNQLVESGEID
jgi:hypothetical protein